MTENQQDKLIMRESVISFHSCCYCIPMPFEPLRLFGICETGPTSLARNHITYTTPARFWLLITIGLYNSNMLERLTS